jgi:phage-related protein
MASIKNLLIRLAIIADDIDGPVNKTTRGLERVARQADATERSLKSLSDRFDSVGAAASRITSGIASFTGRLTSAGVSLVTGAAQLATLASALSLAGSSALSLAAALAPAAGILAALPGGILLGAAALGTLKLALGGVGEAFSAALSGDYETFMAGTKDLAASAGEVAYELFQMAPAINGIKSLVQDAFFAPLVGQMWSLLPAIDAVTGGMVGVAGEFGRGALELLEFVRAGETVWAIQSVFMSLRDSVAAFVPALRPLLDGFRDLGVVGAGWLANLAPGIAAAVERLGNFMHHAAASGQALEWLDGAALVFKQLGAILGDVFGIIAGIFRAIQADGQGALGIFGQLLDRMHAFVDSAEGQQTLLTIFRALSDVGKALIPVILAVAQGVATLAPGIAQLAALIGPILAAAVNALAPALAAIVPGITAIIQGLGSAVQAVLPALQPLGGAIANIFATLQPLLAAIGPAIAALLPGVELFFTMFAQGLAELTPALQPIGAALGGIFAALAPLLPVIGQLAALIATSLAAGVQAILPSLAMLVDNLGRALLALAPIVPLFVGLAASIINALVPALAPLLPQIAALVTQLISGLVPALTPLIPIIAGIVGIIGKNFVEVLGVLIGVVLQLLPPISQTAQILGQALLTALTELQPYFPQLLDAFLSVLPAIVAILPPLAQLAAALMPQFIDAVVRILPLMPDLVRNMIALQQAAYPLIPLFLDLLTKMAPHIPQMIQLAAVIAEQLLPPLIRLSAVVVKMVAEVNKAFQLMYDKLVGHSIIPDLINGIDRWFGKLPEMISGWVGQAKDWAIGKFQELIGWVSGLPGMIVGALGNMGSLLGGVGHDLIIGFWNGLVGMWDWLRTSIYNFFSGIMPQWVKDALGIASPSKVFAKLGRELPAGMALGITQASGLVESAIAGLATSATIGVGGMMATPAYAGATPPTAARGGNVYHITVEVPVNANPADTGAAVVDVIQEYERRSGAGWRS